MCDRLRVAPDLLERVRAWTYRRQLLGRSGGDVADVLRGVFGVYSSHPTAPLALWARSRSFTAPAFLELERLRAAVRVPAMRGSIFLLAAGDAALAVPSMLRPLRLNVAWLRYLGTTAEAYPSARAAVLAALADEPLLPAEVDAVLGESVGRTPMLIRQVAAEAGAVRVGADSLRSNAIRYVATASWMPELLAPADPDKALAEVAGRYLAAYGPARVEDFRWWSGATKTRAKAAVGALDTVDVGGGLLLLSADAPEFESAPVVTSENVDILPKWDSYTMGHAADGRERFVAPEHQRRVFSDVGDGLGTVLVGGRAVAAWSGRFAGDELAVTLDPFDRAVEEVRPVVDARFEEIAWVLGGDGCTVTTVTSALPETETTVGRRRSARARSSG